jgi:hypothetical protein
MRSLRLETFEPARDPERARASALESMLARAREEAYEAGYLAGQAAATESFMEEQAKLSSALIEAIEDSRLTNEAARRGVMMSLAPFVETLFATLAPALAERGLAGEIARLVQAAVEATPGARARVRCAPEVASVVGRLLSEQRLAADVEEAPELLPREAQVAWDQGFDHLDLDGCIAQVRACIEGHLQSVSEGDDDDRLCG